MQIAFKTKNFKLTKKTKKYIQGKLLKYNKQIPDNSYIEINLEDIYGPRGGRDKKVHLSVDIPGEEYIYLEEITSDVFASIDLVFKKFNQKIKKVRGKLISKKRKQRMSKTFNMVVGWMPKQKVFKMPFPTRKPTKPRINIETQEITEILDDEVAVKRFRSVLTPFYLYRNRSDKKLKIIYRDKNNGFKVIQIK
ncbi:MAG: HPF/RaiA family ribosome-associated protein [bacterium]